MTDRTTTLQTALAGEHAAVYGYGAAGALLRGAERTEARTGLAVHQQRRAVLTAQLQADGAVPVGSAAVYQLPVPFDTAAQARELLATVEARLAGPYADLVLTGDAAWRTDAASWLSDSAIRRARWGGGVTALPGLE
jgi:hypothetical protein